MSISMSRKVQKQLVVGGDTDSAEPAPTQTSDFYGFLWISMGFFSPSLIAVFKVQGHIGPERVVGGKAVCSTGRAIGRQWAMVWTDGGVSVWR